MSARFRGRLGLQQRVLPSYRAPFFDMLARVCEGGLEVFAGKARRSEGIVPGEPRIARHHHAANLHIFSGPAYLCLQRGIRTWLRDWDPDALIIEANPRYLATASALGWMHDRGRPVIGWGLGAPPMSGALSALWRSSRTAFLNSFDGLIAYSKRGAREYVEAGFPAERVFVATNAVEPRPAAGPPRKRTTGAPTILFVGRLQARKHVDWLLRACAELPAPHPRLVIVGDGPERDALQQLARRSYPAAEFVGSRHGNDLESSFLDADLFVLPGTGGLAVQQAMAHALPVIVGRGDGTQDDLVREANGWQIPADDYTALARTIQIALADIDRLRRMGEESIRIVKDEINLESMVAAFGEALGRISPRHR